MIRTIKYTVSEDFKSITPASKQWGGIQYEDNATVVAFEIPNSAGDDILWRIDLDSCSSGYEPSENLTVKNGEVSRPVPYKMTRYGGEIQVTLVGTTVNSDNEAERVICSIPAILYFTDVERHEEYEGKIVENISAAEKSAIEAAKKVIDNLQAENLSYDNSKSGLESENIQDAIDELSAKTENAVSIDSWQGVQRIVNAGLAYKAFKIGDVLKCGHSTYGEISWDVVDATTERLTLCAHNIIDNIAFDGREAIYYAKDGLPAGNYEFSTKRRLGGYTADNDKIFNFTLTKAVPVQGHLVLDVANNEPLAGSNIIVYANAYSTDVREAARISEGKGSKPLGGNEGWVDGSEASYGLNNLVRAILGSNNYQESAIRQWLNSDGEVGAVWQPKTKFDRPPAWNTTHAGFLNGLDEDFLEVISCAEYDVFKHHGSGVVGIETLTDRFMLPSRAEVYAGIEGNSAENLEGKPFPYFSDFSDHSYPSKNADTNRIKTRLKDDISFAWWGRTPNVYSPYIVHVVLASGAYSDGVAAVNNHGVVPVCHIIKKTGGNTDV